MRIVKEHGERRREILDSAEELFTTKGYAKTTINDILAANNIAKGTFYHYFAAKEDVMDAIISRFIETEIAAAKVVAEDSGLSAHEKMFRILSGVEKEHVYSDRLEQELQSINNAEMNQKTMALIVLHLAPVLTTIVKQGVKEGSFKTEYPKESIEVLLAASEFLLHGIAFDWSRAERLQKAKAISVIAEQVLGVEKGRFCYLYTRYESL